MNREPFETMPDVMDVKQIAQALHLSKAGVYNFAKITFPVIRQSSAHILMGTTAAATFTYTL